MSNVSDDCSDDVLDRDQQVVNGDMISIDQLSYMAESMTDEEFADLMVRAAAIYRDRGITNRITLFAL